MIIPTSKDVLQLKEVENQIICADVLDGLAIIPDGCVSLVNSSPPYNLCIGYNSTDDDLPYKEYLEWLKKVFAECAKKLRTGGRMMINIDAMTNRQEDKEDEYVRPIYVDMGIIMREIGMKFYGEHLWYKGQRNGKKTGWGSWKSPSLPAIKRSYEYLLLYSKEQFRLEKDENSKDSDLSGEEFQIWIDSFWKINPETRRLGNHPVPFPIELPRRCIKMYSYPNDLVLDPFSGTGTTALAAKITKRRYIGIDIDKGYCEYAERRLKADVDLFDEK